MRETAPLTLRLAAKRRAAKDKASDQKDPTDAIISRIDNLAATGRGYWITLMSYLAFIGVTIMGVRDADFFLPGAQTHLPVVNIAIPTFQFMAFAPAFAMLLYVYFHLHLRKVVELAADLPRTHKNQPVEEHLKSWLVLDYMLMQRADGAIDRRILDWAVVGSSIFLGWVAAPLIIAIFWWRSWPAHDEGVTLLIGLFFSVSFFVGQRSYASMRIALATSEQDNDTRGGAPSPPPRLGPMSRAQVIGLIALVSLASWVKTEGGLYQIPGRAILERAFDPEPDSTLQAALDWRAPYWLQLSGAVARVDLAGLELTPLAPRAKNPDVARKSYRVEWCRRQGLPQEVCSIVPERDRTTPNHVTVVRQAWCAEKDRYKDNAWACRSYFRELDRAFLAEWRELRAGELSGLSKPSFRGIDLRRANLSGSTLSGVDFRGARLDRARLSSSQLERANFSGASMRFADLTDTTAPFTVFDNAVATNALFDRSDLRHARFVGTAINNARFDLMRGNDMVLAPGAAQNASFVDAQLLSARLSGAFAGSDFRRALLTDAEIRGVQGPDGRLIRTTFHGTDFSAARFELTRISNTDFEVADFERARFLRASIGSSQFRGAHFESVEARATYVNDTVFEDSVIDKSDLGELNLMPGVSWANVIAGPRVGLPAADPPLIFQSCWESRPDTLDGLLELLFESGISRREFEEDYVCSETNLATPRSGPTR